MNNFKVKCTDAYTDSFTVGRIYNVSDGMIITNYGSKIAAGKNIEAVNAELFSQFKLVEEDKKDRFKKEDLRIFDVVEWRNGDLMLLISHEGEFLFSGVNASEYEPLESYDKSLLPIDNKGFDLSKFEVVKVYRPKYEFSLRDLLCRKDISGYELLWKEPQKLSVTIDEIADKFGVKVENLEIIK